MVTNLNDDVKNIKNKVIEIVDGLVVANNLVLEALSDCNTEKFSTAKSNIQNITKRTNDIDNDIVRVLALYNPEAKDLRQVVSYFKITNELLRATTSTRSFIKGFTEVCSDMDVKLINEYAIPMQKSTATAVKLVKDMMDIDCIDELQDTYNEILIEENKTDDLYEMVEKSLLIQAKESDDFEKFHNMLKALRKSEKIADRAISIANLLLYVKVGGSLHQN